MQTIDEEFSNTLEIKHSKFIAHLLPYSNYQEKLKKLKIEHPKARHFVVAFRYLNEFNQVVEHSSDDGEPKGTSGKPSLMVLQGNEMINTVVIIVRYFGGTKLGTGGLVRAYSEAVNLVIDASNLISFKIKTSQTISLEYGDIRQAEYDIKKYNITVLSKDFGERVEYRLEASKEDMEAFMLVTLNGTSHIPHWQEYTKS